MEKLLDKYLRLVRDYKFSDLYNRWAFLCCVSACLERKCWLNENAIGYLYPNLYCLFVGPPASRKTTTAKVPVYNFIQPMADVGGPILGANQQTPASLIAEMAEIAKRENAHKTCPLFVVAGEFGVWFKDIGGGSMVDLLLEFYDSRVPGEMWRKGTRKWGIEGLPNPALTLLGCTTPKEIVQSRILETAGLGFTSRVIFVCEPRFIPGTTRFTPLDQDLRKSIATEFYRINAISGEFTYGPGAEDAVEQVIVRVNKWMEEHIGSIVMANFMARKPVQVRKVAMLLSAMRDSRRVIRAEDVLEAEQLLTETEVTLPTAFGLRIEYGDAALAAKINDRVPMEGNIGESHLLRMMEEDGQAIPMGSEWEGVLQGFEKSGRLRIVNTPQGRVLERPKKAKAGGPSGSNVE